MSEHKIPDGMVSDTKRFYLPGIKINRKCPHCNVMMTWNGDERYLSYPKAGKFNFHFYCEECDEETYFDANLIIKLEIAEESNEG